MIKGLEDCLASMGKSLYGMSAKYVPVDKSMLIFPEKSGAYVPFGERGYRRENFSLESSKKYSLEKVTEAIGFYLDGKMVNPASSYYLDIAQNGLCKRMPKPNVYNVGENYS